jgi:hypothetical protein
MNILELIADAIFFGASSSRLRNVIIAVTLFLIVALGAYYTDAIESNYKTVYKNQDTKCFTDLMEANNDNKMSLVEYMDFDICLTKELTSAEIKKKDKIVVLQTKDQIKKEFFTIPFTQGINSFDNHNWDKHIKEADKIWGKN